jgi:hypothetical protein
MACSILNSCCSVSAVQNSIALWQCGGFGYLHWRGEQELTALRWVTLGRATLLQIHVCFPDWTVTDIRGRHWVAGNSTVGRTPAANNAQRRSSTGAWACPGCLFIYCVPTQCPGHTLCLSSSQCNKTDFHLPDMVRQRGEETCWRTQIGSTDPALGWSNAHL